MADSFQLQIIIFFEMVAILFLLLNLETYILGFQVLDRGEKIELLVDKSENLRFQVWTIGF
jgi:hypothetical protein